MNRTRAADIVAVAVVTLVVFWRVLHNDFVNWDDPIVLVQNARLGTPQVLEWAFSTTLMGHYQPLAWLVWSAAASLFGRSALTFHALSLLGHAANAALVYIVALRLSRSRGAAFAASILFAVHPVRVEAVAW